MNSLPVTCHFRRGLPRDALALSEFAARTFADSFGAENSPEDMQVHLQSTFSVERQAAEIQSSSGVTILGLIDDALVAYAQVRESEPPACVSHVLPVELHRFYVDKSAHGRGVAQGLMSEVFAAAREFGGQHVWLGVWEDNPRAIAFYRKFDFEDVGSADFFLGPDRQTDRIMVAKIPEFG